MVSQLAVADERERQQIAADLHDGICQILAAIRFKLDLARRMDQAGLHNSLDDIGDLLRQADQTVRSAAAELSPPVLRELGMVSAAHWLSRQMQQRYRLHVRVSERGDVAAAASRLNLTTQMTLFRCLRELLINTAKHAQVRSARLELISGKDRLRLRVSDHGVGFSSEQADERHSQGGLGLTSIRDRLAGLDGQISIVSNPGHGTQATIDVPLRPTSSRHGS